MNSIHPSPSREFIAQRARMPLPPIGFGSIDMPVEDRNFLESEAIETFTRMVNSGSTFQSALLAVFLTGAHFAKECMK